MLRFSRILVLTAYFGLVVWLTLWSLWWAPHPHFPRALVLMVLVGPLLLPLRGLLHGRVYTHAWSTFLALYYFVLSVDDIATATTARWLAWTELALSLIWFGACLAYVRLRSRRSG